MHKKLAADLTSLAHSILQMKNKEDVFALKAKAHDVYEKLALLAYVEEYINTTPNATTDKESLIASIAAAEENNIANIIPTEETENLVLPLEITNTIENIKENTITSQEVSDEITNNEENTENSFIEEIPFDETLLTESELKEIASLNLNDDTEEAIEEKINFTNSQIPEQPFDELENILFGDDDFKDEASFIENLKNISETEESEIPELTEEEPIITNEQKLKIVTEVEESTEEKTASKKLTLEEELEGTISVDVIANLFEKISPIKKTLNDRLVNNSVKIDLNDRIAFVKNLFEGNQEDFNRVVSQLNTIKSEKEAKNFILKMVKPDYDWSTKEPYELRLLEIIERRFN